MNSKERVLMALTHKKPDRVPFNFWMDRRLMAQYESRIGDRNWRVTHYGADVIETFPKIKFPEGKHIEQDGTRWLAEPYQISWEAVDMIPMPDPNDEEVYSKIKQDIDELPETATFLAIPVSWGKIRDMRGHENIYLDMMDHPEEFKALSRRITDVLNVIIERACDIGVTAVYMLQDLASAKGLFMSPQMTKEFCLDFAKEQADVARSKGVPVLFHCCGAAMDLFEPLVSIGVNAVNPLQPHLNDLQEFKSRFGDDLTLYGGLDNCFTIAKGSPEEVRAHVREVFDTAGGKDGSLIFSTHDISIDTPSENIEALISAIKECVY